MAFDRTFAAAYIDNGVRHKIFGSTLRPFSLWHLLLLQVVQSPFITAEPIELFDLKTAVAICTLRYGQSRIRRSVLPLFLRGEAFKQHVEHFMIYVGDYLTKPEYTIQEDPSLPHYTGLPITDAPGVIITAYNASAGARMPVNQVWDMPIGQAYISEAMYFRMQGNRLNFMDEEERQFQEEMKKAGVT